jgi:hypothetical protein
VPSSIRFVIGAPIPADELRALAPADAAARVERAVQDLVLAGSRAGVRSPAA